MPVSNGGYNSIYVGGNLSGQAVSGHNNTVVRTEGAERSAPTEQELGELRAAFTEVRDRLETEAGQHTTIAQAKLDELEEAVVAPEPDLPTMEHVHGWFKRKVPSLTGAVSSLILHPIVARLVSAAGDELVQEFSHRFG